MNDWNPRFKTVLAVLFLTGAVGALFVSIRNTNRSSVQQSGLLAADDADPAPDFTLPRLNSSSRVHLRAAASAGPVVATFWATWCMYCPDEIEHLESYAKHFGGRIQFYAIDAAEPDQAVSAFVQSRNITLPVLLDRDGAAQRLYHVDSFPTLMIVDTHGRLRHLGAGYDPNMDRNLLPLLDELASESTSK
ncbi:MAG: TlpA family protein disulfide reductase [Capsulimonadaceae bacterium]